MKLTVLRNFIAISYCGSFTKAAEQLLISQPTLSRQISDLEKELGVKLFERNKDGLHLSPAGEILMEEAKAIVDRTDRVPNLFLSADARPAETKYREILRVGFQNYYKLEEISRIIPQLRSEYPEADVHVSQESSADLINGINNNAYDIVFGLQAYFQHLPDIQALPYRHNRFLLAVSANHPLAKEKGLRIRDLKNVSFILYDRKVSPVIMDRFIALCVMNGFSPSASAYVTSLYEAMRLAGNEVGAAFIYSQMDPDEFADRYHLCFPEIEEETMNEPVSVIYNKKNPKASLHYILDHLHYERFNQVY